MRKGFCKSRGEGRDFFGPGVPVLDQHSTLMHYFIESVARPAGLEPATYGLEGRCTIRLCYGRRARSIPFLAGLAKSSHP